MVRLSSKYLIQEHMNKLINYKYLLLFSGLLLAFLLRFIGIEKFPPSPYWEETALGVDAYSISQTLKDHHGNFLPILAFESFGDFKPALYFYAIVPFIFIFDLSLLAVRLPSVISGVLIVYFCYKISDLFGFNKNITLFVAAVSPWAIIFSRAGWEVNLAVALVTAGVYFSFKSLADNKTNWLLLVLSAFLFALSAYAYHAARVIAPILFAGIFVFQNEPVKYIKNNFKTIVVSAILITLLISPLLLNIGDQRLSKRFAETSIFNNLDVIIESNKYKDESGNSFISSIIYHRYVLFGKFVLNNFFSHFNLSYLFINGDSNPRHSIQIFGQQYLFEILFLILGIYFVVKSDNFKIKYIFLWIVVSVIPASLTYGVPHSLRTLFMMPAIIILIGFGIEKLYQHIYIINNKLSKIFIIFTVLIYLCFLSLFLYSYKNWYAREYQFEWQYGHKEMLHSLGKMQKENPEVPVFISREQGRTSMFYFFYNKIEPEKIQFASRTYSKKDQSEILNFEKVNFIRHKQEIDENYVDGISAILVGSEEFINKVLENEYKIITNQKIINENGTSFFNIVTFTKK